MALQNQQCFTVETNAGVLRELKTNCEVCAAFDPAQRPDLLQNPPFRSFVALWDTGATSSAITDAVVQQCGLLPTGMARVHGVHGAEDCETFLVNVGLPNRVIMPHVTVTRAKMITGADILIGMDIISTGDFSITNFNARTCFSFRWPSCARIDFVQDFNRQARLAKGPGGVSGGKNKKGHRHRR